MLEKKALRFLTEDTQFPFFAIDHCKYLLSVHVVRNWNLLNGRVIRTNLVFRKHSEYALINVSMLASMKGIDAVL